MKIRDNLDEVHFITCNLLHHGQLLKYFSLFYHLETRTEMLQLKSSLADASFVEYGRSNDDDKDGDSDGVDGSMEGDADGCVEDDESGGVEDDDGGGVEDDDGGWW